METVKTGDKKNLKKEMVDERAKTPNIRSLKKENREGTSTTNYKKNLEKENQRMKCQDKRHKEHRKGKTVNKGPE